MFKKLLWNLFGRHIDKFCRWWLREQLRKDAAERKAIVDKELAFMEKELARTTPLTEDELAAKANINFNTAWGGLLADSPADFDWDAAGPGPNGEYIPSLNERIGQAQAKFGVRQDRTAKIVDDAHKYMLETYVAEQEKLLANSMESKKLIGGPVDD